MCTCDHHNQNSFIFFSSYTILNTQIIQLATICESKLGLEQRKTIINLYNSGISAEIISLELDMKQEEVMRVIESETNEEERRKGSVERLSNTPLLSRLYLDSVVSINRAIDHAQSTMWKALKVKSEFNISTEESDKILEPYAESKVTLVILNIDLVESTKLSMILPVDKFATIIRTFAQEMTSLVTSYGGYVLKYVGDAVLAFFIVGSSPVSDNRMYMPCMNAISCACSMIRVIRQGVNPILQQSDYPELKVRIGIDAGVNVVVQYGWDTFTQDEKIIARKPHLDILGYTINVASKITTIAKPDQIVIGQLVYDVLEEEQKRTFHKLSITPQLWNYVSAKTGNIYNLYSSIREIGNDS
jgi:adenylate cyclase